MLARQIHTLEIPYQVGTCIHFMYDYHKVLIEFFKNQRAKLKEEMLRSEPGGGHYLACASFYHGNDNAVSRLNEIYGLEMIGFPFQKSIANSIRKEFFIGT